MTMLSHFRHRPRHEAFAAMKRGAHPYPEADDRAAAEAFAALKPELDAVPVPSFVPAAPRDTAAQPALAEAQTVMRELRADPGTQPMQAATLARVRDGILNLDAPNRTAAFVADRKALPFFASIVKETGWHGLHLKPGQGIPVFRAMRAVRWEARQLARIGYVTEAARSEMRQRAEAFDRAEAMRRAAVRRTA